MYGKAQIKRVDELPTLLQSFTNEFWCLTISLFIFWSTKIAPLTLEILLNLWVEFNKERFPIAFMSNIVAQVALLVLELFFLLNWN